MPANPNVSTNTFSKGLVKDVDSIVQPEGTYTHARGAVNNTHQGAVFTISNEQSNLFCASTPYTYIGHIHLYNDSWVLFSTDNINSEIGLFKADTCSYTKIVNSICLDFSKSSLITGASKINFDQTTSIYWDDGRNPSRHLNINTPPFFCKRVPVDATDEFRHYNINEGEGSSTSGCTLIKMYGGTSVTGEVNTNIYYINCWGEATTISLEPDDTTQFWVKDVDSIIVNFSVPIPDLVTKEPMMVVIRVLASDPIVDNPIRKNTCYKFVCSNELDCERLRLARLISLPCLSLKRSQVSGTLLDGSYQAVIAYTVNGIRVSDYSSPSNVVSLFSHDNVNGSIELNIDSIDLSYDEFELVIISTINQQTVAKRIGLYSISQKVVSINNIDVTLPTIPLNIIAFRSLAIEKSDSMYEVNDYLMRVGIYSKPELNYQLQANKIITKWQAVQYPADYYRNGNNVSYMRDEVYAFTIRWVYNTGEKTASYHIPGRLSRPYDLDIVTGPDSIELSEGIQDYRWMVQNTATVTALPNTTLSEGGVLLSEGLMGYWESSEYYPNDKPGVYGTLCGKSIRHHKFPDNNTHLTTNHYTKGGNSIIVMGVSFEGITPPLDIDGNPVFNIVGYEILRGSREGQKTVIAKGMVNNMREYTIPGSSQKALFQNYPYNDLRPDKYLINSDRLYSGSGSDDQKDALTAYKQDILSFHSPDTNFSKPFLSVSELRLYQEMTGTATGRFEVPYQHPKFKVLTDGAYGVAAAIGAIMAVQIVLGKGGIRTSGTEESPVSIGAGGGAGTGYTSSGASGIIAGLNVALKVIEIAADVASVIVMTKVIGNEALKIVTSLVRPRQYAIQYNSHGLYDDYIYRDPTYSGNKRRRIQSVKYIGSQLQEFNATYRINNLFRQNYVAVQLTQPTMDPGQADTTRRLISDSDTPKKLAVDFNSTLSSFYTALKVRIPGQYGQIDSIKQLPVSSCTFATQPIKGKKYSTGTLFGGDTYIGRYTEKNPFFFFNDWLVNFPDDIEYDYRLATNIAYPRYWIYNQDESIEDISIKFTPPKLQFKPLPKLTGPHLDIKAASNFRHLNRYDTNGVLQLRGAGFYLFCNGVRDFFVESEVNITQRDWDDDASKRFYDPQEFTDLSRMFRSDTIKTPTTYKYDYSLSTSKLYQNYTTWGSYLDRDYDPELSVKAFTYYPYRVIYSLQQQDELKKDNWTVFLANNYKDFPSKVTSVKSIAKTGALIMMESESPLQFAGVDQLQTTAGVKITIGDGALFEGQLQNIVNTDISYEYGSCQSRYSVIGTPYGVFWISQNQGKIFQYSGGLSEISREGNKWWFSRYLPSQLLQDFPDFELKDNSVIGVGCQAIYDNTNEIIYITKKDYKLKDEFKGLVTYVRDDLFLYNNFRVYLGNPSYFEDASWTMSFDPKGKQWVSHHDWHPTFMLPGKDHFMTVLDKGIWKHNEVCDSFCNFYGGNYPFEVEYVSSTGQTVNTIRSIEYLLECYTYANNCQDKFHVLDYNFDRAIISNSEQVSGLLKLNITPKNAPAQLLEYPRVNPDTIDILYSKEENKYRFDQFWDITKDRGEFTGASNPMFVTSANGYTFNINRRYVDYNKDVLQRKKFRHYTNKIFLRKLVSGPVLMSLKLVNTKLLQSFR